MTIIEKLKKEVDGGFYLKELEIAIGLPKNSLSSILKGKRRVGKKALLKIEKYLSRPIYTSLLNPVKNDNDLYNHAFKGIEGMYNESGLKEPERSWKDYGYFLRIAKQISDSEDCMNLMIEVESNGTLTSKEKEKINQILKHNSQNQ